MEVLRRASHQIAQWSGGLTTELFIYPEQASYANRDFLFRLSTATVEIEHSTFTPLPGTKRTLMLLDGAMTLTHQGHHSIHLTPLQKDVFDGAWETESKGRCSDFNLMCRENAEGDVFGHSLKQGEEQTAHVTASMHFLYVVEGSISINDTSAERGDLIVFRGKSDYVLTALEDATWVAVHVNLSSGNEPAQGK